jgi:hypothetical protein
MKSFLLFLLIVFSSSLFSQQIDENILEITGLRKFYYDNCNCKTKKITSYDYIFFGLKKNIKVRTKYYNNKILNINNGYKIIYDSSNNYIRTLVNSDNTNYKLDTVIKVFFNLNNPQGKKGGQANYNAEFHFKNGLLIRKDRDYHNDDYIASLFYSYDSNRHIKKVFNQNRSNNKKLLVREYKYDSSENITHIVEYDNYKNKKDTTFLIKYFYNENNQLIKEQEFDYGFLYQNTFYNYNEKGLIIKETYLNRKSKWENSFEIIYNERNQETETYQLNKRGKRKRLVTKYEYDY